MWPVSQPLCAIVPEVVWHVAAPLPHTAARGKGQGTDVQVEDSASASCAGDRILGPSGIQSNVQSARGEFSWAVAKGSAASSYAKRLEQLVTKRARSFKSSSQDADILCLSKGRPPHTPVSNGRHGVL